MLGADVAGAITSVMAELNVDLTRLPDDVREKLAELELELSEGKYLTTSAIKPRTTKSQRCLFFVAVGPDRGGPITMYSTLKRRHPECLGPDPRFLPLQINIPRVIHTRHTITTTPRSFFIFVAKLLSPLRL